MPILLRRILPTTGEVIDDLADEADVGFMEAAAAVLDHLPTSHRDFDIVTVVDQPEEEPE